jgi:hypothetical protein
VIVSEKFCAVCGCFFDSKGGKLTCSQNCAAEYKRSRQESVEYRHTALLRLLDKERAATKEPLRNLEFYRSVLEQGCCYCHTSLTDGHTGICLDRLTSYAKHVSIAPNGKPAVVGCCGLCNRIRGSGLEGKSSADRNHGFSFEEMVEEVGPAIQRIRARRARPKFRVVKQQEKA